MGARHAGACRSLAARGAREDALPAPQRLLLTRPPTATGRRATMLEKNGTPEKNQELNLSGIMSLLLLETWLDRASALRSALFHPSGLNSKPGSPPATLAAPPSVPRNLRRRGNGSPHALTGLSVPYPLSYLPK